MLGSGEMYIGSGEGQNLKMETVVSSRTLVSTYCVTTQNIIIFVAVRTSYLTELS
jgi:hypothetical protein